jgi:hypothetical protein
MFRLETRSLLQGSAGVEDMYSCQKQTVQHLYKLLSFCQYTLLLQYSRLQYRWSVISGYVVIQDSVQITAELLSLVDIWPAIREGVSVLYCTLTRSRSADQFRSYKQTVDRVQKLDSGSVSNQTALLYNTASQCGRCHVYTVTSFVSYPVRVIRSDFGDIRWQFAVNSGPDYWAILRSADCDTDSRVNEQSYR